MTGLSFECLQTLSARARALHNQIFDYCTYAADPQYQTLHKFRMAIAQLTGADQSALIAYFNQDPAIQFHGMTGAPYEYYAAPY